MSRVARGLPLFLVFGFGVVTFLWNMRAGISWQGPEAGTLLVMTSPVLIIALYARWRGAPGLAEAGLFVFLYLAFPMLGVRLSYLLTLLDRPLVDHQLQAADTALGFDWLAYSTFVRAHPWIDNALFIAYMTPIFQAVLSSFVFGFFRASSRNYEIVFILSTALVLTLVAYAIFPATGPESLLGRDTVFADTIRQLRAGKTTALPYTGLVSFPSYHTIMAIAFTYGFRDVRPLFLPILTVNILMLLGLTSYGGHYLVDEIGGALIAAVCIMAARLLYPVVPPKFLTPSGAHADGATAR